MHSLALETRKSVLCTLRISRKGGSLTHKTRKMNWNERNECSQTRRKHSETTEKLSEKTSGRARACVCGLMYGDASRRYHIHHVRSLVRHQITEMANRTQKQQKKTRKQIGKMSKTPGTIHSFVRSSRNPPASVGVRSTCSFMTDCPIGSIVFGRH